MKIAIVGAGGHGRVVLDIINSDNQFSVSGFLDANSALKGKFVDKVPVLGDLSEISQFAQLGIIAAVVAIGDNVTRDYYARALTGANVQLINAIHRSANIATTASIGTNAVIASGVNICAHVTVEDGAICNTGCVVDHESHIGYCSHICPGVRLAGHVTVEPYAMIGIGATVIQGITIGQGSTIGAGAVVLDDVPPHSTVVGVPARIVKVRQRACQDHTLLTQEEINLAASLMNPKKIRSEIERSAEALV
ncbi:MAG: acetyltransferase [Sedimentisphaerales bacterium]|nr:acetyltransferase [Sedimentisphaerales bacterium]